MERETIVRLAKESGADVRYYGRDMKEGRSFHNIDQLEHFVAAVAAAVKEEDARICIDYANRLTGISHHDHPPADEAAVDCADEIRASIKEGK